MVQLTLTSILQTLVCSSVLLPTIVQGLTVRKIYQGTKGQWYENLRVRSNGSLLVTRLDAPLLFTIDPTSGQGPQTVHNFSPFLSLVGLTETEPDLFAITAGNFSAATAKPAPGSHVIWKVDYRSGYGTTTGPLVSKLAALPEAASLNGMTYVPSGKAIYLADSLLGLIYRMDLNTGAYRVAINNTLTQKCGSNAIAVNGLKFFNSNLYWTNSGCGYYAKMAVDANGNPTGSASIVSNPNQFMDDFDIASDGTAYLAGGLKNQIFKITPNAQFSIIAGDPQSSQIAEPTALAFGRTAGDISKGTVYITTGGALGNPINGTVVVGPQLLAIDTK